MGILQVLDDLPELIVQPPGRVWSVFARSLGESGASGRTALAWRWALTGACPSPVTLAGPLERPPHRAELVAEASAPAELARPGTDPEGQVMQARFVLEWLAGTLDALPLWNGGPDDRHVTDGASHPHARAEIERTYSWALLAQWRHPWQEASAPAPTRLAFGWAYGVADLLAWACGEAGEGPLSGRAVPGRPTFYDVSLDASRAMAGLLRARQAGDPVRARRLEALMETFLWLAGWRPLPPVDRHGHGVFEDCPEGEAPCECDAVGQCLHGRCPACSRVACVHGFGQGNVPVTGAGTG